MKNRKITKTLKELKLKSELTQEQLDSASNNRAFAKALKELRLQSKLTQEQLAELSNISYKYLQKLESKTSPSPTLTTLNNLAIGLNISISDIVRVIKDIDNDL